MRTVTVYVPYQTTQEQMNKVSKLLEQEQGYNPAWQGYSFALERDDYPWIDGHEARSEYDAVTLLNEITSMLTEE